ALLIGLKIAQDFHFYPLQIETNSQVLQTMIDTSSDLYLPLILDCRLLKTQLRQSELKHIYREANNVADLLAKHGMTLAPSTGQHLCHPLHYDEPPPYVLLAFNKDCSNTCLRRTIPLCTNS
ncbi:hypothetical protein A4A49_60585, partial [Nicotiana attenuata]